MMVAITMNSTIDFAYLRDADIREVIKIHNIVAKFLDRQEKALQKTKRK